MLWFKAFHLIFMVCWFAGLFYLPRLFLYHTTSTDRLSQDRFKTMEHRLFYFITLPSAILTTVFGVALLSYNWSGYFHAPWMLTKLTLVLALWGYTLSLGKLCEDFRENQNRHSTRFYRIYNEVPSILLIFIVILVVVKP